MLLNKGRELLGRSGQRSDARNLQRDLDKIQHQWEKLKKDTVDRQTRLQTCMVNTLYIKLIIVPLMLNVSVENKNILKINRCTNFIISYTLLIL